jgi:hypothetical protein
MASRDALSGQSSWCLLESLVTSHSSPRRDTRAQTVHASYTNVVCAYAASTGHSPRQTSSVEHTVLHSVSRLEYTSDFSQLSVFRHAKVSGYALVVLMRVPNNVLAPYSGQHADGGVSDTSANVHCALTLPDTFSRICITQPIASSVRHPKHVWNTGTLPPP